MSNKYALKTAQKRKISIFNKKAQFNLCDLPLKFHLTQCIFEPCTEKVQPTLFYNKGYNISSGLKCFLGNVPDCHLLVGEERI